MKYCMSLPSGRVSLASVLTTCALAASLALLPAAAQSASQTPGGQSGAVVAQSQPAVPSGKAPTGTTKATPGTAPAAASVAASSGPVHIVTYVELPATSAGQGSNILKRYRTAVRKANASQIVEIFREIGRPGRFAIRTTWADAKTFEAHAKDAAATQLTSDLAGFRQAPPDQRVHDSFGPPASSAGPVAGAGASVGASAGELSPASIIVLTHVDVPPPLLAELEPMLQQLATASRKEAGATSFELLQQASRKNHFTMVEAWQNVKAHYQHEASPAARQFREKLGPMLGALYDQRIYTVIK